MPHQMEVVAAVFAAVTGLVDERPDNVDAEAADGAFLFRHIEIRHADRERVEWRPIIDETYLEAARSRSERHRGPPTGRMRSITVYYGIGEKFFENNQKPQSLVIWQAALERELVNKSLQPRQLRILST
jgi:hypothetical protein